VIKQSGLMDLPSIKHSGNFNFIEVSMGALRVVVLRTCLNIYSEGSLTTITLPFNLGCSGVDAPGKINAY
jgi:hypothetical protein